jgi:peptide/nickel transport system substrate-binding protein
VDELEFQIVTDDATRILKLKAGEIHGTEFVPFARVAELRADPQLRMELWPAARTTFLGFNIRPTLKDGTANPLASQKLRQALNYAVNKDAVIAITTRGLGTPMRSYMPASTPLFHGPAPLYPYDVAKAKALLAESGVGPGVELGCLTVAGNQDNLSNLTTVQQMWAQIGVKLRIEQVDSATLIKRYRADDFQMRTSGWTSDISDPGQVTMRFAYYPNIQSLRSGWESVRVNELYVAGMREIDVETRGAAFKEIQQIYADAATIVPLYETPYPVAFRREVHGFVQLPLGNNLFEGIWAAKA